MITQLRIENFKSWRDTGEMRLAPITAIFGANSSGKTALLQWLLMLKQTVESADRKRVLYTSTTNDERAYVDLGTFSDIVWGHQLPAELKFFIQWKPINKFVVFAPNTSPGALLEPVEMLEFSAEIVETSEIMNIAEFKYTFYHNNILNSIGMQCESKDKYILIDENYDLLPIRSGANPLPSPVKCYGFPDQAKTAYQNASVLSDLELAFQNLSENIYYLGPLREYPHRSYVWAGDQPQDVGRRGERSIPALLATRKWNLYLADRRNEKVQTIEARIAEWLQELGLIEAFTVEPIAPGRNEYEVRVKRSADSSEVLITDVGFGVSQVLPVLILCYYVPEGSTIILEQPEIHLHPAVQAGLADVFIDAIKTRHIQLIIESHSEHLLHRLQRRIAEEELTADQTALYFTKFEDGESRLEPLNLDEYGNITNWPKDFFGDEMGDLVALTKAEMRRRQRAKKAKESSE